MSLYVNTNINSLIAQNSLSKSTSGLQKAITRLSTGYKVNQAGDDAAGICVAQRLSTQVRGNKRAMLNVEDGLNMMYIVEGGMSAATEDLQRIRELCLQAANGIYSDAQKQTLMAEMKERLEDINVIAETTTFNGLQLTNGTYGQNGKKITLQSGSGSDGKNNSIDITSALTDLRVSALGVAINIVPIGATGADAPTDLKDPATAAAGDRTTENYLNKPTDTPAGVYNPTNDTAADRNIPNVNGESWNSDAIRTYIDKLDKAIDKIAENRSQIGAYENRLQSVSTNLSTMNENYERSYSQIMDADMAEESAAMVKYQVLQQTSAAMLSQANNIPQTALQLLGSR